MKNNNKNIDQNKIYFICQFFLLNPVNLHAKFSTFSILNDLKSFKIIFNK